MPLSKQFTLLYAEIECSRFACEAGVQRVLLVLDSKAASLALPLSITFTDHYSAAQLQLGGSDQASWFHLIVTLSLLSQPTSSFNKELGRSVSVTSDNWPH
jgi:hypothetical protein